MISPSDLQALFAKVEGTTVPVDLLRVGQSLAYGVNKQNGSKLRLAIDMEDCLDRFYGGYYSDWACGGQWNRAYQFVALLVNAFDMANIEIVAFFDGTLSERVRNESQQKEVRQKTISVLKHIRMIGTPPPKIWWLHPSGIRTCIRNALRCHDIQVIQTVHDHRMEIIDYYRECAFNGILGLNADYIIANTHHYYSSHDLRLSYTGSIETKEFLVSKMIAALGLGADHLPYLAVFLGGGAGKHASDRDTHKQLWKTLGIDSQPAGFETKARELAKVIQSAPVSDVQAFVKHLKLEQWSAYIKQTVEYYQRKGNHGKTGKKVAVPKKTPKNKKKSNKEKEAKAAALAAQEKSNSDESTIDSKSKETKEVANCTETTDHDQDDEFERKLESDVNNLVDECDEDIVEAAVSDQSSLEAKLKELSISAAKGEPQASSGGVAVKPGKPVLPAFVYTLPSEVIKTAYNRHQCGMMDSRLYQLLTKKEIVFPQILEDEQYRDVPSVHLFYRPARQMIYAILFNMNHQKYIFAKHARQQSHPKVPTIEVNEWIWSPQNEYKRSEAVHAVQLPWPVPTIQRLWFGGLFEDKQRRMKAFLTVMRSDNSLMLNRDYVPQHMLVLATVLRYIVTNPERNILSRQELDAFLATAFSPHIVNIEYLQELVLPCVHLRGVYLGTLFMQGVETASMANDACGVPLPWTVINPWLFFDGKLFHLKLKMSTFVQSLRELCEDHIEIVLKIERFRRAILEDVEHFLMPAYSGNNTKINDSYFPAASAQGSNQYYPHLQQMSAMDRRRSVQQQIVRQLRHRSSNEYQLKVGGVVVGSWAGVLNRKSPNIHQQPNMFPANQQHQHRPHRVSNHFLYSHRNKKKGVIIGGRKTPAESKATKTKPKRLQIKQKPSSGVDALPAAQTDASSSQSDSATKSDAAPTVVVSSA